MTSHEVPMEALSDALKRALRGRTVRAAIFTTFSFEPEFFEDEVLPDLFDQAHSHVLPVRRLQLRDRLRRVEEIAVYYDPRALIATGRASLDVRRIGLRRPTGCFHPKVVAVLVENDRDERRGSDRVTRSLVVVVTSANLTRAGWWDNVEVAHVAEIEEGASSHFARDVLEFLGKVRREDRTGGEHRALDRLGEFLRRTTTRPAPSSQGGTRHARFWFGQQPLAAFLADFARPAPDSYTLEVISPFFDDGTRDSVLTELRASLAPKETRVLLPRHADGRAACSETYHATVAAMPRVRWAELHRDVTKRSRGSTDVQSPRGVHAKVYRLWSRAEGREFLVVGSPNLTSAAHGRTGAGNLEAAAVVDLGPNRRPSAWLTPLSDDRQPVTFGPQLADEGLEHDVPAIVLRFSWATKTAACFWEADPAPSRIELTHRGVAVATVTHLVPHAWVTLDQDASAAMESALHGTSYVQVSVDGGAPATVLVREEDMAHAPSPLLGLSVRDILTYWSLLSTEQQQEFLDRRLASELLDAGVLSADEAALLVVRDERKDESLFGRFAGIFHAFARLEDTVGRSLTEGPTREAEYRLFGRQYDSLPVLLDKVVESDDGDPVSGYVTALTARQLVDRLREEEPEFFRAHAAEARELQLRLDRACALKDRIRFSDGSDPKPFLDWFEPLFLREAARESAS